MYLNSIEKILISLFIKLHNLKAVKIMVLIFIMRSVVVRALKHIVRAIRRTEMG